MTEQTMRYLGSHYRLGELLGRGAMGEVYVAEDVDTGVRYAAKLLRADHTDDDEVTARFLQERKLLRELTHPNIVSVHELVVDRDQIGIVMDLIEGEDLRKHLRRNGRLRPHDAVRIAADVLAGLSMAHSLEPPIQHRDVKPDNVLLSDEKASHVYLTDFGVARLAEVGTSVKLTNGVGTSDYMAPEMTGAAAGAPADVYAVGITLYELLAGHTPFGKGNFQEVALRHVTCLPPALDGLPADLWPNLEALLVKNPSARPSAATAEARLRALLPGLEGSEALAPMAVPTEWRQIAGGLAGAIATGTDDPGTVLKGQPAAKSAADLPVAGLDAAVGLRRDGFLQDDGATSLGTKEAFERDISAAAPVVVAPARHAERTRNPLMLMVAVAVGVIVLVGGGIAVVKAGVLGGGSGGSGSSGGGAAANEVEVPNGSSWSSDYLPLTISRSATWDPSDESLAVTVSYSTTQNSLASTFFESVPATNGTGCNQSLGWQGNATKYSGIGGTCGWTVDLGGAIHNGKPATVTYTTKFPIKGGSSDGSGRDKAETAINSYLQAEESRTEKDLSTLDEAAQSPDFIAQRMTGLQIDPITGVRARQAIQVTVFAALGNATATRAAVLYRGTDTTDLALALGGRNGKIQFSQASDSDCNATYKPIGRVPAVDHAGDCALDVTWLGATKTTGTFTAKS